MRLFGSLVIATACVISGGCVDREAQKEARETTKFLKEAPKTVATTRVVSEVLRQSLDISGEMMAGEDSPLSALQPGRISAIFVREGDQVRLGQLLARLEPKNARDQLRQARATLTQALASEEQARSGLDQAERNAAIGPQKSISALKQAQAQLRSARAAHLRVLAGARPEERKQAETNVVSAQIALDTAQQEFQRTTRLVTAGAIAGKELEMQRSLVASARATYENAVQNQAVIQNGNRKEDIEQALEQVHQAEEAVQIAQADRLLDPLLQSSVHSARAQVKNARAQVDAALAALSLAQQVLRDTEIRSPFSGRIHGRPVQVGTVVDPGTAIARVIGDNGSYFNGQLPGSRAALVQVGMRVTATVEGLRGTTLSGRVAAISPATQGSGRLLRIRIQLARQPRQLKPGMFVKGQISLKETRGILIPRQAILSEGTRPYVFLIRRGIAEVAGVTLGTIYGDRQHVFGISAGDQVVTMGQHTLIKGDKVTIDATSREHEKI